MAQWAQVCQLPQTLQDRVMSVYAGTETAIPIEVRHHCAFWIENQQWNGFTEAQVDNASYLLSTFVGMLDDDSVGLNVRQRYKDIAGYLQATFANQPLEFVRVVNRCLKAEKEIIESSSTEVQSAESEKEIGIRIDYLYSRTIENGKDLQIIQAKQHEYANMHEENKRYEVAITRLEQPESQTRNIQNEQLLMRLVQEKQNRDNKLLIASQEIRQKRMILAQTLREINLSLESLVMQVIDVELAAWKQKQKLVLVHYGAKFKDFNQIERLQDWCEKLADIIVRIRNHIDSLDQLKKHLPMDLPDLVADLQPENKNKINSVLCKLVTGAFIVEQQPYQVLKKGSKFDVSVRWLVHSKLAVLFGTPKIKQTLISEEEARRIHENIDADEHQEKETVLTKELRMECPSLKFKDVKVKTISRTSKAQTDNTTVAEQKYGILFSFPLKLGEDLVITVRTMTLPVVMTTHGSYERSSTATYLWDNHFSRPGRIPFHVPNEVGWPEFANMLTTVFHGMTGRHLSNSNLQYIGQKLFGTSTVEDFSSYMVSKNQFVKNDVPGFDFKFWDWFWLIAKLVREHLKGPWNDGLIEGFADKVVVNKILLLQPIGTFILRFSDGTLGGLTIAWVGKDPDNPGQKCVFNLEPYNSKDFTSRGLADRIKDLTSLVSLYPDIPKYNAFGKYYSQDKNTAEKETRGYIPHTLVNVIPSLATQSAGTQGLTNIQFPKPVQNSDISLMSPGNGEVPELTDLLDDIDITDLSLTEGILDQFLMDTQDVDH